MATKEKRFRPMLGAKSVKDLNALQYPVLASPKYDGIRCLIRNGRALARSLKPIRNRHIRCALEALGADAEGFDGEIMLPYPAVFHDVSSAVSAVEVEPPPDWFFVVFDCVLPGEPFFTRAAVVRRTIAGALAAPWRRVKACEHVQVDSAEELAAYERIALAAGHEGVMVRAPDGPYKCGRATAREGYLSKVKRFTDGEAEIVGVIELQRNRNAAFVGELGQTKRRTVKAGKVDGGIMGKLVVRDLKTGVEFKIGTGFDLDQRATYWRCRDIMPGKIVRYRYQAHGTKNKPRIASFAGIRDRRDMSA